MATLYPCQSVLDETESERQHSEQSFIEQILQLDKNLTRDWVIYYSFSFKCGKYKKDISNRDCEVDFLILIPDGGIFVLEVKGGTITREMNDYGSFAFYSTNINGDKNQIHNPYEQAKDNFYNLNDYLGNLEKDPTKREVFLKYYAFDYLVNFPDMESIPVNFDPLWHETSTLLKGGNLYKFLIAACKKAAQRAHAIIPSKRDIDLIVEALNGKSFTYKYDLSKCIDTANVRINMLTEEQKTVFNGLLDNKRCLIMGKAGTGKTVLSEMLFKKNLLENKTVAYFSYNIFNTEKVESELKETEGYGNSGLCIPFLDYVFSETKRLSFGEINPVLQDGTPDYSKIDECIDYLIGQSDNPDFKKFSVVIVDEAQDLKKNFGSSDQTNVLMLFDAMIEGGIKDGSFYVFYDDGQTINYGECFYHDPSFGDSGNGYRYAKFSLSKNCRNTKTISDALTKYEYGKKLEILANDRIMISESNDISVLVDSLIEKTKQLIKDGVKPSSITILHSANKDKETTIISLLTKKLQNLMPYSLKNAKKYITYTSDRKFKGLESDIVLYLRFKNKHFDTMNNVDYVSISRAKSFCFVFNLIG